MGISLIGLPIGDAATFAAFDAWAAGGDAPAGYTIDQYNYWAQARGASSFGTFIGRPIVDLTGADPYAFKPYEPSPIVPAPAPPAVPAPAPNDPTHPPALPPPARIAGEHRFRMFPGFGQGGGTVTHPIQVQGAGLRFRMFPGFGVGR